MALQPCGPLPMLKSPCLAFFVAVQVCLQHVAFNSPSAHGTNCPMKLSQLPKSRVKLYLSSQPPQLLSAFTAPPSLMASIKTFDATRRHHRRHLQPLESPEPPPIPEASIFILCNTEARSGRGRSEELESVVLNGNASA